MAQITGEWFDDSLIKTLNKQVFKLLVITLYKNFKFRNVRLKIKKYH